MQRQNFWFIVQHVNEFINYSSGIFHWAGQRGAGSVGGWWRNGDQVVRLRQHCLRFFSQHHLKKTNAQSQRQTISLITATATEATYTSIWCSALGHKTAHMLCTDNRINATSANMSINIAVDGSYRFVPICLEQWLFYRLHYLLLALHCWTQTAQHSTCFQNLRIIVLGHLNYYAAAARAAQTAWEARAARAAQAFRAAQAAQAFRVRAANLSSHHRMCKGTNSGEIRRLLCFKTTSHADAWHTIIMQLCIKHGIKCQVKLITSSKL